MKMRKIMAAAIALTVVCGVQTALTAYQPVGGITAVAEDYTETSIWNLTLRVYTDHADVVKCDKERSDMTYIIKEFKGAPVTGILDSAFEDCIIETLRVNDGMKTIGHSAFKGCTRLKTISLPDSLTTIGNRAFENCESLESISLPASIESYGTYLFQDCKNLKTVELPNTITKIENSMFSRCIGLESIDIPLSVTSIDDWAFIDCESMESITIPNSVVSIGREAFVMCKNLKTIKILNPNCEIYDSKYATSTISNDGKTFYGTIIGYKGSTAEAYAEKYGYKFEAITGEVNVAFGDPTGDGKIDAKDSSFALVEYAKLSTGDESALSEDVKSAADVNKDSKIDSKDASAILSYYAYVSTGGTDSIQEFLKTE